ncbi:hypothetical protein ACVWYG_003449 [Pedobacter sp. UYEF25]
MIEIDWKWGLEVRGWKEIEGGRQKAEVGESDRSWEAEWQKADNFNLKK